MKQVLLAVLASAFLGCAPAVALTRTGPTAPARPSGCDFAVLSAPPAESYTELGTIDLQYKSQTEWITKEAPFKRAIRPLMCQSGGDAAIAHINENGLYQKATVISTKPIAPEKAPTASASSEGGEAEKTASP
jgi:hypothetical protein